MTKSDFLMQNHPKERSSIKTADSYLEFPWDMKFKSMGAFNVSLATPTAAPERKT